MATSRRRPAVSAPADATSEPAAVAASVVSLVPSIPMRQQILQVAEDFYVLRGYDGFSFAHIAEAVQTTRANIHHHFGDKLQLMAELIEKFATSAETRIAHNWTHPERSFGERLQAQLDDLHQFYNRFNHTPGERNVWSPLSRLRLDLPVLGELATQALQRVDMAYDRSLRQALADAIALGELEAETPVDDVARVLRVTLLSCAPMTQDSGSFAEIEKLFGAMQRLILAAWSTPEAQTKLNPKLKPKTKKARA